MNISSSLGHFNSNVAHHIFIHCSHHKRKAVKAVRRFVGPLPDLVPPCFRGDVISTSKSVSLFASFRFHNFLLKNVVAFLSRNQISKSRLFEKNGISLTYVSYFDLLFNREMTLKFLRHISHLYTYTYFARLIGCFAFPILQKIANLSCMISIWCHSLHWFLFAPVCAPNNHSRQSINNNDYPKNGEQKFKLAYLLLIKVGVNLEILKK